MEGAEALLARVAAVAVAFACALELLSECLYSAARALLAAAATLGLGEARADAFGTASRRASTAARVSGSKASREAAGGEALALSSSLAPVETAAGSGGGGHAAAFAFPPFPVAFAAARDLVTLAASSAAAEGFVVPAILHVSGERARETGEEEEKGVALKCESELAGEEKEIITLRDIDERGGKQGKKKLFCAKQK